MKNILKRDKWRKTLCENYSWCNLHYRQFINWNQRQSTFDFCPTPRKICNITLSSKVLTQCLLSMCVGIGFYRGRHAAKAKWCCTDPIVPVDYCKTLERQWQRASWAFCSYICAAIRMIISKSILQYSWIGFCGQFSDSQLICNSDEPSLTFTLRRILILKHIYQLLWSFYCTVLSMYFFLKKQSFPLKETPTVQILVYAHQQNNFLIPI